MLPLAKKFSETPLSAVTALQATEGPIYGSSYKACPKSSPKENCWRYEMLFSDAFTAPEHARCEKPPQNSSVVPVDPGEPGRSRVQLQPFGAWEAGDCGCCQRPCSR